MNKHLNYKWLALALTPTLVILTLFQFPQLWKIPLGQLKYESPLYPFLDMKGRLAAMEAYTLGLKIYEHPNPFDPMHRISTKPSYPLHLGKLGLNLDHTVPLGLLTICSFIVITVICLKPRNWREVTYGIILICSPPILLGIERANDDLVLYCLLMPIPLLLASRRYAGLIASVLLILLITPVKYYPAATFILLLHSELNTRRIFWAYLFGLFILFTQLYLTLDEILFLKGRMPNPETAFSVGSKLLFSLLGLTGHNINIARAISLLITLMACIFVVLQPYWSPPKSSTLREYYCIFGTAIFGFCYYASGNWDYRMLYLLPCIPYLWRSTTDNSSTARWLPYTSWLILSLLPFIFFAERIRIGFVMMQNEIDNIGSAMKNIATLKQLATWIVITCLSLICSLILKPRIQHHLENTKLILKGDRRSPNNTPSQSV